MSTFDRAFDHIIKVEGGYVDDPNDAGGETKYGISKAQYPSEDIKNLTLTRAAELYKRDFWDALSLDGFQWAIGIKLFDLAVNMGAGDAVRVVQRALNYLRVDQLKVDGVPGSKTHAALAGYRNIDALMAALCGFQFAHYAQQREKHPTQQGFAAAWAKRAMYDPRHDGQNDPA